MAGIPAKRFRPLSVYFSPARLGHNGSHISDVPHVWQYRQSPHGPGPIGPYPWGLTYHASPTHPVPAHLRHVILGKARRRRILPDPSATDIPCAGCVSDASRPGSSATCHPWQGASKTNPTRSICYRHPLRRLRRRQASVTCIPVRRVGDESYPIHRLPTSQ